MVTGALMRRNLFLKVASILWLVGIAISQINHYLSGALIGLGILALAIGFAEALAEDRGIQLFGKKGTRYGIALFAIGGALLIGGGAWASSRCCSANRRLDSGDRGNHFWTKPTS